MISIPWRVGTLVPAETRFKPRVLLRFAGRKRKKPIEGLVEMWWFKTLEQQLRREMIVFSWSFFPYILVNQDGEHGRCFEMHFMGCSIAMLVYYRVLNVFEKMSCTKIFVPPGRCCKKLVKPEGNSIRLQQYYAESCASNISPWIAVIETQDLSIWTCSAERLGWCLFISYISIH